MPKPRKVSKRDKEIFCSELFFELLNEQPDETIAGMKVKYHSLLDPVGSLGMLIPIAPIWILGEEGLEPQIEDHYAVLDEVFRYAPQEVKEAAVEHEKIHKKWDQDFGQNITTRRLIVNTIAFMESGNPLCLANSYICREIRRIKNQNYSKK